MFSAQPALPSAHLVSVECDIIKGLHAFTVVGLPDKAVEEAKDRIAAAIKNSEGGFQSPKRSNKKIVFSLAPAELKKEGAVFDIPLALSYLLASKQLVFDPAHKLFAGELALDGAVRPIRGTLSIALAARDEGFTELYVPEADCEEASLVSGITIYPVRTFTELVHHLSSHAFSIAPYVKKESRSDASDVTVSLSDIRGQESAKRGLEIAAAGRHNIALYGPPGTGKTMFCDGTSVARATVVTDEPWTNTVEPWKNGCAFVEPEP